MERRQSCDPAPVMMGAFLNIQLSGQGIVGMQVTGIGAEMGTGPMAHPPVGPTRPEAAMVTDERIKRIPGDAGRRKRRVRHG